MLEAYMPRDKLIFSGNYFAVTFFIEVELHSIFVMLLREK